jgi:hypothetical protein
MTGPGRKRPAGIALLTALVVVLLLTFFLSEFFFATGLELRAIQNFRQAAQAGSLARSALRAVEIGLMQDEVLFMSGYRQMQQFMVLGVVPMGSGRLVELSIEPLDARFNLNEMANLSAGDLNYVRWTLFEKLMAQIPVNPPPEPAPPGGIQQSLPGGTQPTPPAQSSVPPTVLPLDKIDEFHAALMDWMDTDDVDYQAFGYPGAESNAYYFTDPEYTIKNAPLDRLEEIRLIRGFMDLRLPWAEVEKRFSVRPKQTAAADLYPEKLNVNLATRQEIMDFLRLRHLDNLGPIGNANFKASQTSLNEYADKAQQIADALIPDETIRTKYTADSLRLAVKTAGGVNEAFAPKIFSTYNQYYRVRLTTEVDDVQSRVDALVYVQRKPDRTGSRVEVLQYTAN